MLWQRSLSFTLIKERGSITLAQEAKAQADVCRSLRIRTSPPCRGLLESWTRHHVLRDKVSNPFIFVRNYRLLFPPFLSKVESVLTAAYDSPGQVSATKGHHFANPTNHFWPCLFEGGIIPTRMKPEEDSELPEKYNIGIVRTSRACDFVSSYGN